MIGIQAICIAISRLPTQKYDLGVYGAASSVLLLAVVFIQYGIISETRSHVGPLVPFLLEVAQLALTVLTALANVSIPRRPAVFIDGMPVDRMNTETAFSKYTFAWTAPMLAFAGKKGTLDLNDLARPDHTVRSKDTVHTWHKANRSGKLWVKVFLAHKVAFSLQWFLTLLQAFGNVAPQFCLLHILRILEIHRAGTPVTLEAWIWVLALGFTTLAASWIESWLFWISQSALSIPVRAQLSALIFEKSMRRKDVKGASKTKLDDSTDTNTAETNPNSGPTGQTGAAPVVKKEDDEVEEDSGQKSRQATVNLIGVDAKRVADFCSFNNYFPGAIFKLTISFTFLFELIGWKSLLAGLGTMAIIIPFNIYFSKRYSEAQDRLMKVRDAKLGVVNEALQGIKQIKWTATEKQWQDKIGKVRNRELKELWSSLLMDTGLFLCWVASPIMFSATSLAVYALIHGELTPSVAFTSIGIFKSVSNDHAIVYFVID